VSRLRRSKKNAPAPASESALRRTVRAVPWMTLMQGTVVVGRRWAALSEKERARLTALLRRSRGRLANLSAKERAELGRLARKLDVKGMGRELAPLVLRKRSGRRRGR
jgi:hypothetical protein